jgi:hypothetical protein
VAMAFDTLAYARRLREAGFTEKQAEGQAEALAAAMTDTLASKRDLEVLATRQDLHDLAATTRQDLHDLSASVDLRFERLDARVQTSLADLERRMTMRLGGIMVAGIGVVSAFVRML